MPTSMRSPRLLIGLLVLATVLVDLVVFTWVGPCRWPRHEWPHPAVIAFSSLAFSQVSLLTIWAVLGSTTSWLRWLGLISGIGVWVALLTPGAEPGMPRMLCFLLSGQAMVLIGVLSIAHLTGIRLVTISNADLPRQGAVRRFPRQFSLRQILGWTTTLAVVLGLLKLGAQHGLLPPPSAYWGPFFLIPCICQAVGATAALGVTLGPRWPLMLLLAIGLLATPVVILIGTLFLLFIVLQAAWLVGSLLVVRMAGYRLVGRGL